MADALASGASVRKDVRVQVPPRAPIWQKPVNKVSCSCNRQRQFPHSNTLFQSAPKERKDMKQRNKGAVIAASVVTVGALLLASPALAHKPGPKPTAKPTSSASATPTPPSVGDRDGHRGGHRDGRGHGPKKNIAPITKTVTVDVPETGSYQLLVTEVRPANAPTPPAGKPAPRDHSFTVPVTGTGSQTITLNLPHPGDYTVSLISVVSTQTVTVTATN